MPIGKAPGARPVELRELKGGCSLHGGRLKVSVTENAGHRDDRQDKGQDYPRTQLIHKTQSTTRGKSVYFIDDRNWSVAEVLTSVNPSMRINLRTWAVAVSVAVLAAMGAFYVTRPASPSQTTGSDQLAGRDYPSLQSPNPLTVGEIGYRVPRDKIQAIDDPKFMAAGKTGFVPDRMPVVGVIDGNEAKAYPVPLLSRVEIVNDQIGGRAIAVTW